METQSLTVGFLIFPDFTGLDLVGPQEILARANTRCYVVAKTMASVRADLGLQVIPDVSFETCPLLDIFIVLGGPGQTPAMEDRELIEFIIQQSSRAQWIVGICTGVLLLARAGLLQGKVATTHWLAREALEQFGVKTIEKRVVWDENIVTGAGVSAGIDLALELTAKLFGDEESQRIQLAVEYDPKPPYDVGSPSKAPQHLVEKLRQNSRFHRRSN